VDKLIITVTVDSSMSYPGNPMCPPPTEVEKVAEEYVRSINAGASIAHVHGVHKLEDQIQPDGRRLSRIDFDGWRRLRELILSRTDAIIQYGIASARIEEKVKLMDQHPDMMSISFNAHDEYFRPDPKYPANEIHAVHPREELERYSRAALEKGVKVEVECFHTGAYFKLRFIAEKGLLPTPRWATIFVGWPGGTWTPPTPDTLLYMVRHLPEGTNWNCSVMDPATQWQVLTQAVMLGGHVRVGWEDNPYVTAGVLAKSNAELVDKIVRIARELGRETASPAEARKIIGLPGRA
jgi:3-keto-5-aminohexanoate cleavage enzyme